MGGAAEEAGPSAGSKRALDFDEAGAANPGKRPAPAPAAAEHDDDIQVLE